MHSQHMTWTNFAKGEPGCSRVLNVVAAYGELFKCIWDVNFETGLMRWAIYYMGQPEYASRFSFEIEVEDVTSDCAYVCLRAPCAPMTTDEEVVFKETECILSHYKMMRKYCVGDNLLYSVRIIETFD